MNFIFHISYIDFTIRTIAFQINVLFNTVIIKKYLTEVEKSKKNIYGYFITT